MIPIIEKPEKTDIYPSDFLEKRNLLINKNSYEENTAIFLN